MLGLLMFNSRRNSGLLIIAALLVAAGSAFVAVRLVHPGSRHVAATPLLDEALPTVAHPLAPSANQVTLAAASSALDSSTSSTPASSLVLPSTTSVQPSEAGPVWEATAGSQTTVAVTFPAQGLIVEYLRPAPYTDPQTGYEQLAQGINASQVVDLNGTPALVIQQDSDQTGANFGVVAFEVDGSEVRVMGHDTSSTLEQLAQSILDQSGS